jgi:hypothetical protein
MLHEVLLNASVVLLVGSFLIGLVAGTGGYEPIKPVFDGLFRGLLAIFLLDMGLVAGRRLLETRSLTARLAALAIALPLLNGTIGTGIGILIGLDTASAAALGILAASASYIAVPAAIEFAVTGLEVRHIVVMGHGACGGIAAALRGVGDDSDRSFIHRWMSIIDECRDAVAAGDEPDKQRALELEAIKVSLKNLRTFPFIAQREAEGRIKLHGVFFAISEGVLYLLDEASGTFHPA